MKRLIIVLALALATPAHAGGLTPACTALVAVAAAPGGGWEATCAEGAILTLTTTDAGAAPFVGRAWRSDAESGGQYLTQYPAPAGAWVFVIPGGRPPPAGAS